jgi:hypothetical protein
MHQSSLLSGGGSSGKDKALNQESIKLLGEMEGKTLMMHEFLYLIVNAKDRLEAIRKNHKPFARAKDLMDIP